MRPRQKAHFGPTFFRQKRTSVRLESNPRNTKEYSSPNGFIAFSFVVVLKRSPPYQIIYRGVAPPLSRGRQASKVVPRPRLGGLFDRTPKTPGRTGTPRQRRASPWPQDRTGKPVHADRTSRPGRQTGRTSMSGPKNGHPGSKGGTSNGHTWLCLSGHRRCCGVSEQSKEMFCSLHEEEESPGLPPRGFFSVGLTRLFAEASN